ncbi:unnamed protein product [Cyprideis torosa]|uniref:Uncharacterized protein n=1 Tax=Cyprideis torosa TaxID=163714 RepID=A0A7R8WEP5_9CRUS|nr:unnamed protein product [Cyprideis torosa]CAG0896008.1 unnamed protein product [Cyprideis torosa]
MTTQTRNPEATKARILEAAITEFSSLGLGGGRVDKIAENADANKRMIYHYFGGKEDLFAAVVHRAYQQIREAERALDLDRLPPRRALEVLVEFTWKYYLEHPEFITLVNSANLHEARHLKGDHELEALHFAHQKMVAKIIKRGVEAGEFREDVDVLQLCITLAAIGFYYLNNRYTGSVLFQVDFTEKRMLEKRLAFNKETILRLVEK